MKKTLCAVLVILLLFTVIFPAATAETAADKPDRVITLKIGSPVITIDGKSQNLDTEGTVPIIVNGATLVPLRAVFEALEAKVDWDPATGTITGTRGNTVITLTIGSYIT